MKGYTCIIASDHQGFARKQSIVSFLQKNGVHVVDVGAQKYQKDDDFVDYGVAAMEEFLRRSTPHTKNVVGILLCGSGVGMSVVANKFPGVRAVLATTPALVRSARLDDDANVLVFPAAHISDRSTKNIARVFFSTRFSKAARYTRRIDKIFQHEKKWFKSSPQF